MINIFKLTIVSMCVFISSVFTEQNKLLDNQQEELNLLQNDTCQNYSDISFNEQKDMNKKPVNYLNFFHKNSSVESNIEPKIKPANHSGLYIEGNYLYWKPCISGESFIGKGETFPGKIITVGFDWTSGLKAGLGFQTENNWKIQTEYTYLRPKGSKLVTGNDLFLYGLPQFFSRGLTIGPPLRTFICVNNINSAYSHISFDYNVIDAALTKKLKIANRFFITVSGGGRGASFIKRVKNNYEGVAILSSTGLDDSLFQAIIYSDEKIKFDLAGLKFGANGEVFLGKGFLVYGQADIAILYAKSFLKKNRSTFTKTIVKNDDDLEEFEELFDNFYTIRGSEKMCDLLSNFEFEIGLGRKKEFQNKSEFGLFVGYTLICWSNINKRQRGSTNLTSNLGENFGYRIVDDTNGVFPYGDFGIHGLIVTSSFKF